MRIAVVDDYAPDRETIAVYMQQFLSEKGEPAPDMQFFGSGDALLTAWTPGRFDLILLDCCMEGRDGLQTARALRERDRDAVLVFITSCEEYAIDGYLVGAAGYLVKPLTAAGFSRAMAAALDRLPHRRQMITLTGSTGELRVFVDDIVYCDMDGHYAQLHLGARGVVRVRMSFAALRALLADYPQFLVCYRGCLINLAHTEGAEALNFRMDTGERVPFRKKERAHLMQHYADYLFRQARGENG